MKGSTRLRSVNPYSTVLNAFVRGGAAEKEFFQIFSSFQFFDVFGDVGSLVGRDGALDGGGGAAAGK